MDRRGYLVRCGVVGAAALAGCTGDGDDDGAGGGPGSSGSRDADRHIASAVTSINVSLLEFAALESQLDDLSTLSFDPGTVNEHVSTARDELDAAEESANEDQQVSIDQLRDLASVVETLAEIVADVADRGVEATVDSIHGDFAAGRYESARGTVGDLQEDVRGWHADVEAAATTVQGLDRERLDDLDVAGIDEIADGLDLLVVTLAAVDELIVALDEIVRGRERIEVGLAYLDEREYDAAIEEFEAAGDHFAAAESAASDGRSSAPDGVTAHFDPVVCLTGHLTTVADLLVEGTEAGSQGDLLTASQKRDEAEDELDAAIACIE